MGRNAIRDPPLLRPAIQVRRNPFANRAPGHPLSDRYANVGRAVLGIFFVAVGVLIAVVRNTEYAPGDYRASDAYQWISGAVLIAIGAWLYLSIRHPTLRGPWRKRDE
jgi:hypothetical protein